METFKKLMKKGRDGAMALVTLGSVLSADAGNVSDHMPSSPEDVRITSIQERFKPGIAVVDRNEQGEITNLKYNKVDTNGYIFTIVQKGKMVSMSESEGINSPESTLLFQKRDPKGNLILSYSDHEKVKYVQVGTPGQKAVELTPEEQRIVSEQVIDIISEARSQIF